MKPMATAFERRTFLRGTGALLALPWLEATALARPSRRADPRLLWIYVPNGIHMPDWTPTSAGAWEGELPPALAPLDRHKDALRVFTGLVHDKGRANGDGPGDHARAGATWLTGVQPLKEKGAVSLGTSADQVAAKHDARTHRFGSLSIGTEGARNSGQCDSGYACAYSSNVSWKGKSTPAGKESSPKLLFDRICRRGRPGESSEEFEARMKRRKSVLDFVRSDAKRLGRDLGREDRARLDEYLDGVRSLERRVEHDMEEVELPFERPEGDNRAFEKRLGLLRDLILWALATEQTRVVTFMFANEGSNRSYKNLEVSEGHHSLTHHKGDEQMIEQVKKINRYHTTLLAEVFDAMKATPLGESDLFEETIVVYGSGLSDGNRHQHHDLPVLVAGGGAGRLGPARHEVVERATPMMNLHLGVLQAGGVPCERLGDSTGILSI